jgi:glycolate oxidase FAD binding subunit
VLPLPRAQATVRLAMPAEQAVQAFNRWAGQPLPISGAAWWQGEAWVRLSGAAPAVRAARERLGGEQVAEQSAHDFWGDLRDCRLAPFHAPLLWRVSLPPVAAPLAIPSAPLIDWGGAVRWYADVPTGTDVRALARAAGGTAACWRGASPGKRFHPLPETLAMLHRRLKKRFDPAGLFNRGRLLADL